MLIHFPLNQGQNITIKIYCTFSLYITLGKKLSVAKLSLRQQPAKILLFIDTRLHTGILPFKTQHAFV